MAKFIDKKLDKFDNHPSISYTGIIHGYFRNFKRVNRSENRRGAKEFISISEHERENCYISSGNAGFLKYVNHIVIKDFRMVYFEFIESYKRRTNVMTRCKIPEVCERYKIDIETYDLKSERIFPRSVNQRDICLYIHRKLLFYLEEK